MNRMVLGAAAALAMMLGTAAMAAMPDHEPKARAFAEETLRKWMSDPAVVAAIKEQNAKHAALAQADVDRLDKQWRAETKTAAKPLIDSLLAKPVSAYLKKLKEGSQGLVTEIFVMDDKGLNVGQSDVTSDYWQGDEAKWQKTFSVGPTAIFVDKVDQDESTQKFQTQVSMSIVDPATRAVIGAVTVGLDVETLLN